MRKMIRRPTHPGNIIKEDYLLPLSVTIKDMADTLGVSRKTLSKIVNIVHRLTMKGVFKDPDWPKGAKPSLMSVSGRTGLG